MRVCVTQFGAFALEMHALVKHQFLQWQKYWQIWQMVVDLPPILPVMYYYVINQQVILPIEFANLPSRNIMYVS